MISWYFAPLQETTANQGIFAIKKYKIVA